MRQDYLLQNVSNERADSTQNLSDTVRKIAESEAINSPHQYSKHTEYPSLFLKRYALRYSVEKFDARILIDRILTLKFFSLSHISQMISRILSADFPAK